MYLLGAESIHPIWINWSNYLASIIIAAIVIGVVLALMRLRRQKVTLLGMGSKNILKSLGLAAAFGLVFTLPIIGRTFNLDLIAPTIILIFIASFKEEVLFRAYIGPRLHSVFKNKTLSIFVTGLLFGAAHLAGRISTSIMGFEHEWHWINMIISVLFWMFGHVLYNWIYAKYNNIWGPTLLHAYRNFIAVAFVGTY